MSLFSELQLLSLELETSRGKALVFADPHIGFELSRGLRIRTDFEEVLAQFVLESNPNLLIILGDLKEPLGLSFRLKEMLLRFFSPLKDTEVVITKGNHDGRIEEIARKFENVSVVEKFILDQKLFLHGHTKLPKGEFRGKSSSVTLIPHTHSRAEELRKRSKSLSEPKNSSSCRPSTRT